MNLFCLAHIRTQVFYDPSPLGLDFDVIVDKASQLPQPLVLSRGPRVVLHIQTTQQAVDDFIAVVQDLAEAKKASLPLPVKQESGRILSMYGRR